MNINKELSRGHWGPSLPSLQEEPDSPGDEAQRLMGGSAASSNSSTPLRIPYFNGDGCSNSPGLVAVLHQGRAALGRWGQQSSCVGGSRKRKLDLRALEVCTIVGMGPDINIAPSQAQTWDSSKCSHIFCLTSVENTKFVRIDLQDVVGVRTKKTRVELERKDGSSLWLYGVGPEPARHIQESIASCQARTKNVAVGTGVNASGNQERSSGKSPGQIDSFATPPGANMRLRNEHPRDPSLVEKTPPPSSPLDGASDASRSEENSYSSEDVEDSDEPFPEPGNTSRIGEADRNFEIAPGSKTEPITVDGLQADAELVWQSPDAPKPMASPPPTSLLQVEQAADTAKLWRTLQDHDQPAMFGRQEYVQDAEDDAELRHVPSPARREYAVTASSQNTVTQTASFGFSDMQIKEVIAVAQRLQHEPLHQIPTTVTTSASPPRPPAGRRRISRQQAGTRGGQVGSPDMQQALDEFDKYMDETKTEKAPPALIYGLMRERGQGSFVPQNHVVLM